MPYHVDVDVMFAGHNSPQAAGNVTVSLRSIASMVHLRGMLAATWEISLRASAMTTAKPLREINSWLKQYIRHTYLSKWKSIWLENP